MRPLVILITIALLAVSCKKGADPNPFDDPALQPPVDTTLATNPPPASFAGIHQQIFRPTCANSGCHDGTFEPDFRTIEGAYNTLVYQPIIKNNAAGTFTYRVDPFSPSTSVLLERLINDIDGISGIMPLSVDPGSDWAVKKDTFINYIRTWIADGARDMFGRLPQKGNQEPQMQGVVAFAGGQPLPRNPGQGAIRVPANTGSIDVWFSISDDSTATTSLQQNRVLVSARRDDFSQATAYNLTIQGTPLQAAGYLGDPVNYYHKITFTNPGQWGAAGTRVYLRVYVQDATHPVTEIPETGSFNYIKEYFAIELI